MLKSFLKVQFSELFLLRLFALQFITVFTRMDEPAHYILLLISFLILLFERIALSPISWGFASAALFLKLLTPYGVYFFREVDGIMLIGCLAITFYTFKKNLNEVKRYFGFILALMFFNSGLGKIIVGDYLSGTALVTLVNKDKRLSKPLTMVSGQFSNDVKQNESSIDELMNSYMKEESVSSRPLVMSKGVINFLKIFSIFIVIFEVLVGVLGLLVFFNYDKKYKWILDSFYGLVALFIIVTYPLISVTNIGIVVAMFAYSSANLKNYYYQNSFVLLFFYVLAVRFRDYL